MRVAQLVLPLLVSVITAALFVYSLGSNPSAAYAVLIMGAGILATMHMVEDAERDERDLWNAGRAALTAMKTVPTLGVIVGVWLGASGHAEGIAIALFSILFALLWILLYAYYSWRDVQ